MIKRKMRLFMIAFCLISMTACDSDFPLKPLRVEYEPNPLPVGISTEVKITYPDDGILPIVWKNQNIKIVKGGDVLEVSGLTIKGIKPGTAVISVEAAAVPAGEEPAIVRDETEEEKKYTTKIEVKVVDE